MSYNNGYMPNYNMGMNNYNMSPSIDNRLNQLNGYMNQLNNMNNNMTNQHQEQKQSTNMSFIKVANMQQAKEWVVQNGQEVWMQDSSEPYLYYKSVDNLGSANFRILKVDDVTNNILNEDNQQDLSQEYVPISNFNELQNQVNILNDKINLYENVINNLTQQNTTNKNIVEQSQRANIPKSNSTKKGANK